jgi:glucose-1-phosphate cytidylyltransferase
MIREYFLHYNEAMTNDFVLSDGGRTVELMNRDLDNWRITFVDTGLHSNIGQRLLRVRRYLEHEDVFLANYSDGVSNLPLDRLLADFHAKNVVASFASVNSAYTFHAVSSDDGGIVTGMTALNRSPLWINGGYFVFHRTIFDYIKEGDELVEAPFERLIEKRLLATFRYEGFWQAMDTFKDKITLDRMEAQGNCPWMVWRTPGT